MGFKFCCIGSSDSDSAPPVLAHTPPALTPQQKDLPTLPQNNINNSSLQSPPPEVLRQDCPIHPIAPEVPKQACPIHSITPEVPKQVCPIYPTTPETSEQVYPIHPATATPSIAPADLPGKDNSITVRRHSSFSSPRFEMVSGRTPLGAWHAVAAKVVAANRFRGVGRESLVTDFKIEELGGQNGKLVFGPVAVFNGNITLRLKKPLKGMTLTVTFNGAAEVDKFVVTFLNISQDLYVGDMDEGLRTFLFGFNFPYLNLPPTSRSPQLGYSFTAKLTSTHSNITDDSSSAKHKTLEFKTRPLEIVFIPYVDPSLGSSHIPQTSEKLISKERNGKGKGVESIKEKPVKSTDPPPNGAGGPPVVAKPKLTLTTADLPSSASSNSTPIIDRPRSLNPSANKLVRIKDDDNNTVARLAVELPKTKFLPDDEIVVKLKVAVKDIASMPKGLGVRVVEKRFLARIDSESDEEESDSDGEGRPQEMKVIGKKQSKVLAGRKLILHPDDAYTVKETKSEGSDDDDDDDGDAALKGGKEIELPIKVRLPGFQTFINEFYLPTATLPLGSSDAVMDSAPAIAHFDVIPGPVYDRKGKGKSPAHSPAASTPTTATSISMGSANKGLNFVVTHLLQVTVPINGGSNWFKKPTSATRDLEIVIPIVLGNTNPLASGKKKMPEFRLNALEEIRYGSGVVSSRSSGRSSFGSASGVGAPSASGAAGPSGAGTIVPLIRAPTWKEGERFLTLKETDTRPFFIKDP